MLYAGFFVDGFFAGAFLLAVLGAVFLAVGFAVATGFLAVFFVAETAFFVGALASVTPAAFAAFASELLRRAAVALGSKFFLTAVSISL